MNKTRQITLIPLLAASLFLQGCAAVQKGSDPIVVDAQRSTLLAKNTFDLIETVDYDSYSAFKAIDPKSAAAFRTFVNYIRANQYQWLKSARDLTKAYQASKTQANASALNSAIAVLTSVTEEANKYLTQIRAAHPSAWILNDSLIWAQLTKAERK